MTAISSAATQAFERQMYKRYAAVMEKWAPVLDSDKAPPVTSEADRWALAMMLETAERELPAMEASQTTSVFGASYTPALLGMTRQVFPRLIGRELCAIQPLDRPTGKIFSLRMLRDDSSDPETLGAWSNYSSYADFSDGELAPISTGMKLSITDTDVSVGTPKKLKVGASLELMQDLRAYHNLDAMDLLQGAATDEIAREIDGMIVRAAYVAAQAHKTVTFGAVAPNTGGWTADTWRKRLQRAILLADNHIYKSTGRNANFIVAGADAALELMDLNTFSLAGSFNGEDSGYGLQVIGSLSQQFKVLRSRYVPSNELLIGRKGAGFLDAGLVFAPYVSLFISERSFNVSTQGWEQSFMSRFLIHTVSNSLFARVVIDENSNSGIV